VSFTPRILVGSKVRVIGTEGYVMAVDRRDDPGDDVVHVLLASGETVSVVEWQCSLVPPRARKNS